MAKLMVNLRKWQTLASKMVLDDPWCQIRRDEIALPNGKIIDDYFVHIRPDIALILPITIAQEVIFVRQYRHAVGDFFLELPAGRFDSSQENPEVAALRELREETGYLAQDVRKIGIFYDNPSKDTNRIHLFMSEHVTKVGEQNLDITEEIEVVLIPLASVLEKIAQGEISVAGTVTALLLGLNLRNQERF
jgi:8-oxo-dGTP pyrophosphatase MutT (NUDIX family)